MWEITRTGLRTQMLSTQNKTIDNNDDDDDNRERERERDDIRWHTCSIAVAAIVVVFALAAAVLSAFKCVRTCWLIKE